MFNVHLFKRSARKTQLATRSIQRAAIGRASAMVTLEGLEDRCLMSVAHHHHHHHTSASSTSATTASAKAAATRSSTTSLTSSSTTSTSTSDASTPTPPAAPAGATITFSQAPAAVQAGLTTLAGTDDVTAPTSTTVVHLGNVQGQELYTVDITSGSTDTKLTVNQIGTAVTPPTQSTTTFGAITNTAVTAEITAIASAENLTAPTSSTTVNTTTLADGTTIYCVALSPSSSSSTTQNSQPVQIAVDSNGNPVGNELVPLSTLSTAIQSGLTSNAPTGATALTSTSLINVQTIDGVTLYTARYSTSGVNSTVTVNSSGTLTSLPSSTQTTFSAIPSAAQTEIQTLATADGDTSTIASTQSVMELTEANGTVLYTVQLVNSSSSNSTPIMITVDSSGNPTVLPSAPPPQGQGAQGQGGQGQGGQGQGGQGQSGSGPQGGQGSQGNQGSQGGQGSSGASGSQGVQSGQGPGSQSGSNGGSTGGPTGGPTGGMGGGMSGGPGGGTGGGSGGPPGGPNGGGPASGTSGSSGSTTTSALRPR